MKGPDLGKIKTRDGPDIKLAGYPAAGYPALQLGRIPDIRPDIRLAGYPARYPVKPDIRLKMFTYRLLTI